MQNSRIHCFKIDSSTHFDNNIMRNIPFLM